MASENTECDHADGFVFIAASPNSDKAPGRFYCKKGCGQSHDKDPNDPSGVRYLDKPNKPEKKITFSKGGKF